VADWFDDPEDDRPSSATDNSWMQMYITAGLFSMGVLGFIGGMLHILPA
jgi:hypothetical protein